MIELLYWVSGSNVGAGFVVVGNRVTEAAPYLKRELLGREVTDAIAQCKRNGWTVRRAVYKAQSLTL